MKVSSGQFGILEAAVYSWCWWQCPTTYPLGPPWIPATAVIESHSIWLTFWWQLPISSKCPTYPLCDKVSFPRPWEALGLCASMLHKCRGVMPSTSGSREGGQGVQPLVFLVDDPGKHLLISKVVPWSWNQVPSSQMAILIGHCCMGFPPLLSLFSLFCFLGSPRKWPTYTEALFSGSTFRWPKRKWAPLIKGLSISFHVSIVGSPYLHIHHLWIQPTVDGKYFF